MHRLLATIASLLTNREKTALLNVTNEAILQQSYLLPASNKEAKQ